MTVSDFNQSSHGGLLVVGQSTRNFFFEGEGFRWLEWCGLVRWCVGQTWMRKFGSLWRSTPIQRSGSYFETTFKIHISKRVEVCEIPLGHFRTFWIRFCVVALLFKMAILRRSHRIWSALRRTSVTRDVGTSVTNKETSWPISPVYFFQMRRRFENELTHKLPKLSVPEVLLRKDFLLTFKNEAPILSHTRSLTSSFTRTFQSCKPFPFWSDR
jgi:hypothetical protein